MAFNRDIFYAKKTRQEQEQNWAKPNLAKQSQTNQNQANQSQVGQAQRVPINPYNKKPSFMERVWATLDYWNIAGRGFWQRLRIHLIALVLGASGLFTAPEKLLLSNTSAGGVYIGLICLIPAGEIKSLAWRIAVFLGWLEVFILSTLGFTGCEAIFWGGCLTFFLQVISKQVKKLEWLTFLPVLAFMTSYIDALFIGDEFFLYGSFGLLFSIGLLFTRILPDQDKIFLPQNTEQVQDLNNPTAEKVSSGVKNPGQFWERLKSKEDTSSNQGQAVNSATRQREEAKVETASTKELTAKELWPELFNSVEELRQKRFLLTEELKQVLLDLCDSARDILKSMESDPRDRERGERFLRRYLKETHKLVDNHARFMREKNLNSDLAETLEHSSQILTRLKDAFAQEYAALLRNDADDFSADIKVLDKLLKMEGK